MFEQTCASCGAKFSRGANFCPHCGAPTAQKQGKTCRFCGHSLSADARFCPHCGKSTTGSAPPAVVGNTWRRGTEDLATRIEIEDLEGFLRRELVIEAGTRTIILADGRSAGVVGPGRYTLQSFTDKLSLPGLRGRVTALLVDSSEVDLALTINDIYTRDPLKIALDCRLGVSVGNPTLFFTNLLKGRQGYALNELKAYLYDEIQNAAQECIGPYSVADLHSNLALKQEFAAHIAAHLDETLRQTGLRFSRVRTMNYRHARWNELTQEQEEFFLQLSKEEADLEHRKRLFDLFDRNEIQAIAEETRKIAHFEQRAQLRERMRRAVLSDRFAELSSEREMEKFLRDLDREKLIADDEWDRVQRTLQWQRAAEVRAHEWQRDDEEWDRRLTVEDREQARVHLLARLKLENDYELKQIELLQRTDLSQAELDLQLQLERARIEGEQEIEAKRQAFQIEQARRQAAFDREQTELNNILRREQEMQDEQQRLSLQLNQARTAAEIEAIEREQDRLDLELGMLALEKMKAVRRKDDEERELLRLRTRQAELEMELLAEERRLNLRLVEMRQTFEQEIAREAQAHEFELARMERLKDLPPAAVVAVADAERGRIIADMQRTEAMQGMSEQQILAMAAENSPQAAQALAEIAQAASEGRLAQEQQALYERLLEQHQEMLAQKDQDSRRVEEAWRTSADKIQETAHKALDSQREGMVEIARAARQPPAESKVVIAGTGGMPTVVGGGAPGAAPAGGMIQCRRCGVMSPVGTRFCTNCGYEFFATGPEKEKGG